MHSRCGRIRALVFFIHHNMSAGDETFMCVMGWWWWPWQAYMRNTAILIIHYLYIIKKIFVLIYCIFLSDLFVFYIMCVGRPPHEAIMMRDGHRSLSRLSNEGKYLLLSCERPPHQPAPHKSHIAIVLHQMNFRASMNSLHVPCARTKINKNKLK